eukprot:Nitzschia sp. Nitz4//scaffold189_size62959//1716//3002//NITZ4_006298-RA/size62959-processed-gene-0.14-mRNA-1//1//CDS//3329539866//2374//frame0
MSSPSETETSHKRKLDANLEKFYDEHNVAISQLVDASKENQSNTAFRYRFVQLNPRFDTEETLSRLKHELKDDQPIKVDWLSEQSFYALPAEFSLASSPCFREARLYGMDVSSGAAVAALLSTQFDKNPSEKASISSDNIKPLRVLDLCCCPGLKLCSMADLLSDESTVVGVDISERRMALCKRIVHKYHVQSDATPQLSSCARIQLYCQDGTTYPSQPNLIFDSVVAQEDERHRGSRKRQNKSARARERKRLKQLAEESTSSATDGSKTMELYDHVLVDAECSTDGSIRHVQERMKTGATNSHHNEPTLETNQMLLDENQLTELVDLQKRLLRNGFNLLRPGGTLVYSTCSLSTEQNEKVLEWLLKESTEAYVVPVFFPLVNTGLVTEGSLEGTVRFYPNLGQDSTHLLGDGFFLAKVGKKECQTVL